MRALVCLALVGCTEVEPPLSVAARGELPTEPEMDPAKLYHNPRTRPAPQATPNGEDDGVNGRESRGGTPLPRPIGDKPRPTWLSAEGRALAADLLAADADTPAHPIRPLLPQSLTAKDTCAVPEFMIGEDNFIVGSTMRVQSPAIAFPDPADARAFLDGVRAEFPVYPPFRHPDVETTHGWLYANGNPHRATDLARLDIDDGVDPTFKIYAVAPGEVVSKKWTDLGGNELVIRHTAPSGRKWLSIYLHLRDGRSHDLDKAKAIDCKAEGESSRCPKYVLYAKKWASDLGWGTDAHEILVDLKDRVNIGEVIAWAGNTGYGGAGWGLEDSGEPMENDKNIHLHFQMAVQSLEKPNQYVLVDPYGVYNVASECSDLLHDTAFERLIAPFYASFHAIPLDVLTTYFSYYANMGRSPRTLVVYQGDDGIETAGSFQTGLPGPWRTRVYGKGSSFQAWYDELRALELVPSETSVVLDEDDDDVPRFSATFRPFPDGVKLLSRRQLTFGEFDHHFADKVVDHGWTVDDYFGYVVDDVPYIATLMTPVPEPVILAANRPFAEIETLINASFADGYAPVGLNAVDLPGGRRYTARLRKEPGCWRWRAGMTKAQFRDDMSSAVEAGYSMWKIQVYGDDDDPDYLAVWHAPAQPTCP